MSSAPYDPWPLRPVFVAYDYAGTIAPPHLRQPGQEPLDQPVYPRAARMIRTLRDEHGIRAILSSNVQPSEPRRPALHAAGLAEYFDLVLLSTEVGFGKPDPRFYRHLLKEAGRIRACLPSQVVHVGDHPAFDVAAPVQHGMSAVWVTDAPHDERLLALPQVRAIADIAQLPTVLGLA